MGKKAPLDKNPLTKFCDLTAKERREFLIIPDSLADNIFPEGIEGFDPNEKAKARSQRLRKEAGKKIRKVRAKATLAVDAESDSVEEEEEEMGNSDSKNLAFCGNL